MQTAIGTNIATACSFLKKGELVAIPTETVYGLAGNALDLDVVKKIFECKNRPSFDPLIVHTDSLEKVQNYVEEIPPLLLSLAHRFWPGPLTLILKKKNIIPDLVSAGLETVAVRIPSHPLTLELLSMLEFPLAAPSANPFGYISPTSASHVKKSLNGKFPYILDGGLCQIGLESTIVGYVNGRVAIYRNGGVLQEVIEQEIGEVCHLDKREEIITSPGSLKSHYAPTKKMLIGNIPKLVHENSTARIGVISFKEKCHLPITTQIVLSPSGNLKEAASQLFRTMRVMDEASVDLIVSEWVPNEGIGKAINDRLKRASHS